MQKLQKVQINSSGSTSPPAPSPAAVQMVLAGVLIGELTKIINNNYVIEDKIYAFIRSMCVLRYVIKIFCIIDTLC